jgi:cell division septal protein FtsQ
VGWTPAAVGRAAFNVAVLGLLVWALLWFFVSDRFYVDQIIVTGNTRMPADMIHQASGLQGYSSFWIDPQHVASQITDSLPPLESVQVSYGLSDKVVLHVKELEEQIVWQVAGVHYWIDEDGSLYPMQSITDADPEQPTQLWALLVNDLRSNLDVEETSVDPDVLVAARQMIHLLPEVRVVEYAPDVGLQFLHSRGWTVRLGTGSDMAQKANVLRALEIEFSKEDVQPTLVDVRYPDSPYYRMPGDDASESEEE